MEYKKHFLNGYDKINNPINNKPATPYRRKAAAISLFILLSLLSVAALTRVSTTNKPPTPSLSIESTQPKPDPELLFNISLYISIAQLKNISTLPETLITESTDPRTVLALHDCVFLFDDAVSQVNKSINSLTVGPGDEVFTKTKIRELNVWISAAMTDQETCLDGLKEMGSTVCDEVRMKVQLSKQCMSYSLAILAKIHPVRMFSLYDLQ